MIFKHKCYTITFAIVLFVFCNRSIAQKKNQPDTLQLKTVINHSPKKAALLSTFLPGAGQAFNRKYWKIPIIYGAFAGLGYLVLQNNTEYENYKQAYIYRTDNNKNTIDNFVGKYTDDNLITLKNSYQLSRDFAVIGVIAVYLLNIVDAAVDAHLYTFDVSDNLSLQIQPTPYYSNATGLTPFGMNMQFHF